MKLYELSYLVSPNLSEEELKNLSEKVITFLQEEGGILKSSRNPVKIRLGYPIEKKDAVYLSTLNFQLNPEKVENLEKKLKAEKNILRHVILTKKIPKAIEFPGKLKPPSRPRPKTERPEIAEILRSETLKGKPKKVELKEIEKKLEEILKE